MKKLSTLIALFFIFSQLMNAQYAAVQFDIEKNYFNEGQPLPSEKPMMFSGLVPLDVNIIEINIFPSNARKEKHKLYQASWKAFGDKEDKTFSIAINFPLRASQEYDFRIDYFKKLRQDEQIKLNNRLVDLANAYLESNLNVRNNSIDVAKRKKQIIENLNNIITEALSEYRTQSASSFKGFSATISQALDKVEQIRLTPSENKQNMAIIEMKEEIKSAVKSEIDQLMAKDWSQLNTSRKVDDYETEARKGSFSVNLGYGGVYLGGKLDNLDYGTAPYAGVSFPLGNGTLAAQFFRNSSITLGAFFENFEDSDGQKVTGFLVDRPVYLGLDYKLFEFIRFNAGGTFLEKEEISMNAAGAEEINTNVFIRPFIGLSARIDLSVGFGK